MLRICLNKYKKCHSGFLKCFVSIIFLKYCNANAKYNTQLSQLTTNIGIGIALALDTWIQQIIRMQSYGTASQNDS
jgi:hypothetical protein